MDAAIPRPKFDYGDPIAEWLVADAFRLRETETLLAGIGEKLVDAGIPLYRLAYFRRSLHPEFLGKAYFWRRGQGVTTQLAAHDLIDEPEFRDSPIRVVYEQKKALRVRLDRANHAFPVLADFKAEGATDYVMMPIVFADGHVDALSVIADGPDGFSDADLDRMYWLQLLFARLIEIQSLRRSATDLLDAYVGRAAGERILSGAIKRGDGESLRAVIWFSDLRGFTALSDLLPREALIELLNDYFDAVGGVVTDKGGEILKFVGDALLAVFPVAQGGDGAAAARALDAACAAQLAVEARNRARSAKGKPTIAFGLALHIGDVLFGNIGTRRRLDFTVIGPAVNHATRIEALAKPLGRTLVASAEIAALLPGRLTSLGRHALAGVAEPREIFGLA